MSKNRRHSHDLSIFNVRVLNRQMSSVQGKVTFLTSNLFFPALSVPKPEDSPISSSTSIAAAIVLMLVSCPLDLPFDE